MKTQLVVTSVGEDKPGIVARLTELFVDHGANLEESRMAILGGEFAAIMLVSLPEDKVEKLRGSLDKLTSEGLTVGCKQTRQSEKLKGRSSYTLSLQGADHEGIVHSVASTLRERDINIEALETGVTPAPVTGTPLFSMTATVQIPSTLRIGDLRATLDDIAKAEAVEITLESKTANVG